jgi:hypothetical protein
MLPAFALLVSTLRPVWQGAIAFYGFAVSQTIAFGHDWIPAGIAAVQALARERGFRLT